MIKWCVSSINELNKTSFGNTYQTTLDVLVEKVNSFLKEVLANKTILSHFQNFIGKYLPTEVKREEITVAKVENDLVILRIEYFTAYQVISNNIKYNYKNGSYFPSSMQDENVSIISNIYLILH